MDQLKLALQKAGVDPREFAQRYRSKYIDYLGSRCDVDRSRIVKYVDTVIDRCQPVSSSPLYIVCSVYERHPKAVASRVAASELRSAVSDVEGIAEFWNVKGKGRK